MKVMKLVWAWWLRTLWAKLLQQWLKKFENGIKALKSGDMFSSSFVRLVKDTFFFWWIVKDTLFYAHSMRSFSLSHCEARQCNHTCFSLERKTFISPVSIDRKCSIWCFCFYFQRLFRHSIIFPNLVRFLKKKKHNKLISPIGQTDCRTRLEYYKQK